MAPRSRDDRVFRAFLRLFPSEFRGDFGRDMAEDFRDQRADAARHLGAIGVVRLWVRTLADLIWRAPHEHLDLLRRDATHAIRVLRRRPAPTLTVILSLAIGIGLNTALFSVVSGVLWRALPFPDSDRLVRLYETDARSQTSSFTSGDVVDVRSESRTLSSIGANGYTTETIVEPGEPEAVSGARVMDGFFETLAVKPVLGRTFTPEEYAATPISPTVVAAAERLAQHAKGAPLPSRPIVISQSFWQRRFLGRPDVVGQRLRLASGIDVEVIGVMGPEMTSIAPTFGVPPEWWMTVRANAAQRGAQYLDVMGRLAPGQTLASAQAELRVVAAQIAASHPDTNKGRSFRAVPLLDATVANVRSELTFLFGAVVCVLLVTCVNVVHLFLANAAGRRTEFATRVALGATRAHLVRQTLTESALLATIGGAAGLLLAAWALPVLISIAPDAVPRIHEIHVDWWTFASAAAASLGVALVCGLAASVPLTLIMPWSALGRARSGSTLQGRRVRGALAMCEVAVALMLVVASMLMVRTMRRVAALDLGFDPHGVITAVLPRPPAPAVDAAGLVRMHDAEAQVIDAIRQLPGVLAAGVGGSPMGMVAGVDGVTIPGDTRHIGRMLLSTVSVGYFEALGARLDSGRFFTAEDRAGAPAVAILGESAARQLWPDGSAVGKVLNLPANPSIRIVGIVADMSGAELTAKYSGIYLPHIQSSYVAFGQMVIRTDRDPATLVPTIKAIIRRVNPETPFPGVRTLQQEIDRATAPRRYILTLIGMFSVLGVALAAIGVYGVIAESVAARVREIGVRMALGAQPLDIVVMVVRQGMWMIGAGLAAGLVGAVVLRHQLATLVYGVSTLDPVSYAIACVALTSAALVACAVPARRAVKLDPVVALRTE